MSNIEFLAWICLISSGSLIVIGLYEQLYPFSIFAVFMIAILFSSWILYISKRNIKESE